MADTRRGASPDERELEGFWSDVRALVARLVTAADRETFLDDCLDLLVDVTGADRGLILLVDSNGGTFAVNARATGRALSAADRAEVSRTIVREALRAEQTILWEPDVGAAAPSAAALGIRAALVAPLRPVPLAGGGDERGAVYLDFRDARRRIGPRHRELLETAAQLISVVFEKGRKLELAREDLRALTTGEAPPPPSLRDLLCAPSLAALRGELDSCLRADLPILITGESGTGKTLLARAIAEASGRAPVVRATLGQSDDLNTITSELFGHERGAFSGATGRRTGLVEFAHGGTLILDEILNLPAHAQQLLLDFTQFGTYRPLGRSGAEPKRAQVRLIVATNGDLRAAIAAGRFREDLYYRISSVTLAIPPLRARRDEIPGLAESFLRRVDPVREWTIAVEARRDLTDAEIAWPGNVRQLEAAVQRARLRAIARDPAAHELRPEHFDGRELGRTPTATRVAPGDLAGSWRRLQQQREELEGEERELLRQILDEHEGVVAHAAQELGMARTTLAGRLQALKLKG